MRTRNPDGDWLVLPVVNNSAVIEIDTSPSGPDYQIAVLVFTEEPPSVPETVVLLARYRRRLCLRHAGADGGGPLIEQLGV